MPHPSLHQSSGEEGSGPVEFDSNPPPRVCGIPRTDDADNGNREGCFRSPDIVRSRGRKSKPTDPSWGQQTCEKPANSSELLSYPKWCAMLVPWVLKTRTPFSAFVVNAIRLSREPLVAATPTYFPIPLPGVFPDRMPASCSAKKRHSIHLARALFVIVLALNYWHCGGKMCDESMMRRVPSTTHRRLFQRLKDLIKSDGPAVSFPVKKAGRKFPELIVRLGELTDFLTNIGVSTSPYEKCFSGVEVPKAGEDLPEVQPFSDLDPSRLVMHGSGDWDIKPYLSDGLILPFLEPRSIRSGIDVGDRPIIRDTAHTVSRLAYTCGMHEAFSVFIVMPCQRMDSSASLTRIRIMNRIGK